MSEKPVKGKTETDKEFEGKTEKWLDDTGSIVYLIESGKTFASYGTLAEAVKKWDNLAVFVTEESKIMKLRHNEEAAGDKWQISETPLKDIAKAMLGLLECKEK